MTTPNMSCPSGGTFYACGDGSRFVGCCGRNPCGQIGCAQGDLQPASFEGTQHGLIPDQQCTAGAFYTCNGTSPPFWGCCANSPCSDGCPEGLLYGAFLTSNPSTAEPFLKLNLTWTGEQKSGAEDESSTNVGAIAGGVVGGVVVLAILIVGLVWLHRRRKRATSEVKVQEPHSGPGVMELSQQHGTDGSTAKYLPHSYKSSPAMPSWPSSPGQPPYSPQPPSYWSEVQQQHVSHELPGSGIQTELEGETDSRQHKRSPVEAEA